MTAAVAIPASAQTAAATAAPAIPENLYAAVKFPPLPKFTENVMAVARKVEPGPNTELLPMLFLGAFGYPSFPGVSTTEPVTLFAFSDSTGTAPFKAVILAQIAADSPVRAALMAPPLNLLLRDQGDWVLIAQEESAFNAVTDLPALVSLAQSPAAFDVEVRAYGSKATFTTLEAVAGGMIASIEEGNDKLTQASATAWKQLLLRVLHNYGFLGYGLSFNAETIETGLVTAALPGTADAKFIAAPLPAGKIAAGNTLSADGAIMALAGQLNVAATAEYLAWVKTLLPDVPDADARKLVEEVIDLYGKWLAEANGQFAAIAPSLDVAAGKSDTVSISGGNFKLETLDALNAYTTDKFLPSFFALLKNVTGEDLSDSVKGTVTPNAEKIGDYSVTLVSFKTTDPQNGDKQIEQNNYYTVINGALVSASKLEALKAQVAAYSAGQPVANNVADALPLEAGTTLRGVMDFKEVFKQVVASDEIQNDAEAAAELAKISALLAPAKIDPIQFSVYARDTRLVYSASVSLDSVVAAIQVFKAIDAQEQAAQAPAGEVIEIQVQPQGN